MSNIIKVTMLSRRLFFITQIAQIKDIDKIYSISSLKEPAIQDACDFNFIIFKDPIFNLSIYKNYGIMNQIICARNDCIYTPSNYGNEILPTKKLNTVLYSKKTILLNANNTPKDLNNHIIRNLDLLKKFFDEVSTSFPDKNQLEYNAFKQMNDIIDIQYKIHQDANIFKAEKNKLYIKITLYSFLLLDMFTRFNQATLNITSIQFKDKFKPLIKKMQILLHNKIQLNEDVSVYSNQLGPVQYINKKSNSLFMKMHLIKDIAIVLAQQSAKSLLIYKIDILTKITFFITVIMCSIFIFVISIINFILAFIFIFTKTKFIDYICSLTLNYIK